jgi:hypothetical protein
MFHEFIQSAMQDADVIASRLYWINGANLAGVTEACKFQVEAITANQLTVSASKTA